MSIVVLYCLCHSDSASVLLYFTLSSIRLSLTHLYAEKKEEIGVSPRTNAPTLTEKSERQRDNVKKDTKSSITQRLRTDLWIALGTFYLTCDIP